MRRVLVVGSSGFLGAHVVRELRALRGVEVVGAAREPGAGPGPPPDRALPWDLGAGQEPAALLEAAGCDACVDLAALSRGDACEREPELARAVNAEAPGRLAAACRARGVPFVHVSTDLVFDGEPEGGRPYAEDAAARPLHVYGRTKLAGEEAVLAAAPDAAVVRLPLLFGDSLGRAAGASDALLAALDRGAEPGLFVDEWRTPLAVEDAARALVECLRLAPAGRLHVAGPERLSRHELGVLVLEARGRASEVGRLRAVHRADLRLVPPRPRDVSLDTTRARALLSTPLRAPREALAAAAPGA